MYRRDLAYIHQQGFSQFAEDAAPAILEILWKHGIADGLIVEAGCGSGILAHELLRAGYRVHGFDASPAMIELARVAAPAASLEVASFETAALPACRALVAVGEVLNYGSIDGVRAFVARAALALEPGGILVFDIAERGAYPTYDEVRSGDDDWSVIAIKESDGRRVTRRVLTFRNLEGEVLRDEEIHQLELYERDEIVSLLRGAGFRVRVRRSYGMRRLPRGYAVYIAMRGRVARH